MTRTGFKPRANILRVSVRKTRKCSVCPNRYVPKSMSHVACGVECAAEVAKRKREKIARQVAKAERASIRERKAEIRTIPQLKARAQIAFNAFIRERDKHLPCICCGKWGGEWSRGGIWDAGHYRSRGSADHMRFVENNVHRQLKDCNRYGAGRAVDFRIGLIKRIGLEAVEALECNNTSIKWTREMLIKIEATYRRKLKELKESGHA
ncbi:recombination protein NinG [Herminiimonas contaminans]|uniref:Recombination protein NinG n=2 Tax=Herminiimonas contaminans TaxID=1111140 RepID=A0ABS0ESK3_9BURK|nr:recombination protein NinG [Herminiimonas contaminans]